MLDFPKLQTESQAIYVSYVKQLASFLCKFSMCLSTLTSYRNRFIKLDTGTLEGEVEGSKRPSCLSFGGAKVLFLNCN